MVLGLDPHSRSEGWALASLTAMRQEACTVAVTPGWRLHRGGGCTEVRTLCAYHGVRGGGGYSGVAVTPGFEPLCAYHGESGGDGYTIVTVTPW